MDFDQYTNIPWECGKRSRKSADCWGLVLMVLEEQFNIIVNHMRDVAITDVEQVSDVMDKSAGLAGWTPVETPIAGDVVMMFVDNNGATRPEHVGIMVSDGYVLHSFSRDGGLSAIHKLSTINRLFNKLEFHRHATRYDI